MNSTNSSSTDTEALAIQEAVTLSFSVIYLSLIALLLVPYYPVLRGSLVLPSNSILKWIVWNTFSIGILQLIWAIVQLFLDIMNFIVGISVDYPSVCAIHWFGEGMVIFLNNFSALLYLISFNHTMKKPSTAKQWKLFMWTTIVTWTIPLPILVFLFPSMFNEYKHIAGHLCIIRFQFNRYYYYTMVTLNQVVVVASSFGAFIVHRYLIHNLLLHDMFSCFLQNIVAMITLGNIGVIIVVTRATFLPLVVDEGTAFILFFVIKLLTVTFVAHGTISLSAYKPFQKIAAQIFQRWVFCKRKWKNKVHPRRVPIIKIQSIS